MSTTVVEVMCGQFARLTDCKGCGPHTHCISGCRGQSLTVTVELLTGILRKPGNQQKCQKWEMRKQISVLQKQNNNNKTPQKTGYLESRICWLYCDSRSHLDWLIRQVICASLKGSCVHQEAEQGHLATAPCVWVTRWWIRVTSQMQCGQCSLWSQIVWF